MNVSELGSRRPTGVLRPLLLAFALMATVLVPLVAAGPPAAAAATALYPDLQTLPPRDLRFATTTINGASHRVLQFSNTVVNTGQGKLDIVGQIDPSTLSGPAYQRVYDSAGNYTQYTVGTFTWHAVHQHFHFDNWGRYELWTKSDYDAWVASGRPPGQAKQVGTKTTSCVMDEEFIKELPGTPYPGFYGSGGCNLQPDNTLHEGLSPGWGDTYDWYRDEQWIDLNQTPLTDGTYVLRSVTDPLNKIYESPGKSDSTRESDLANEGTTTFVVQGGVIQDSTAPTGTITINGTAASTSNPAVTVSAYGRDDVSGVDSFRLSNDGTTWKSFPYTPNSSVATNVSWNLNDPAYGGTSATGTKTVYAQFHDNSGKWGPSTSDTIQYGSGPPPPPPPTTGYAGTVAADGPVGYWRVGEASGTTAADSIGTNPGTYSTGVTLGQPTLVPTETNTSIALNGSASVRIPDAPELRLTSPLSLEAWIRPTTIPASGSWASVVTKAEAYSLQFNGPQLEFTVIQNGTRRRLKAPAGAVVAGQTYHVVGSYDGSTQRLYINGNLAVSAALTGPATQTSTPLVIGSWDGSSEFFNGRIDDVAVYNTALSGTQVDGHYNAGTGGPAPTTNTVTVSTTGTGSGTVTSSPAGISCPSTCSHAFPSGTTVTLTATAASGSTFSGWTAGACAGTTPACTFNAYAATSATASFALASTPSPTPSASVSPSPSPSPTVSPSPSPSPSVSPSPSPSVSPSPTPTSSAYVTAVKSAGPVGYWRLGETSGTSAADAVGTHTGTYVNGPLLGQPSLLASDPNPSTSFDGINDYVRMANSPDLQLASAISLEAWIRPTAIPASGSWASIVTMPESYSLQFNGPQLEFTVIQSGVRRRLKAAVGAVVTGQTYHVVGTYDGTTQRLYINGTQVASAALTGPASATTNSLYIGSWNGGQEFFTGRIDEVAVYAKTLTASQVQAHDSAGITAV